MKNIFKTTFIGIVLIFSTSTLAEPICPVKKKDQIPWDKLSETAFSMKAVIADMETLKKILKGEIDVAGGAVQQILLTFEGAYYRKLAEDQINDPKHSKSSNKELQFCKFMAQRAYIAH